MTCTLADIPEGNPFAIGATPDGRFFSILCPRLPFVLSRAEALNVIGNLIVLGAMTAKQIDAVILKFEGRPTPRVRGNEGGNRVVIDIHPPPVLLKRTAALELIAALQQRLALSPAEIDAAVARIEPATTTLDDVGVN